jgi:regulatory protein
VSVEAALGQQKRALADGGTITALRVQRRNPERANLHIDDEFCCGVPCEVILAEGLRVGDTLSGETLERLQALDARWRAKESALSLLAVRPRARRELTDRLARKGFAADATDWALGEVDRLGLVDDSAFAEAWVRDRLRLRPRGARALQSELIRKGIDTELARRAVTACMADAGAADGTLCLAAAEKWARSNARRIAAATESEERRRLKRRLGAFLMRRGFGAEAVREAVEACLRR